MLVPWFARGKPDSYWGEGEHVPCGTSVWSEPSDLISQTVAPHSFAYGCSFHRPLGTISQIKRGMFATRAEDNMGIWFAQKWFRVEGRDANCGGNWELVKVWLGRGGRKMRRRELIAEHSIHQADSHRTGNRTSICSPGRSAARGGGRGSGGGGSENEEEGKLQCGRPRQTPLKQPDHRWRVSLPGPPKWSWLWAGGWTGGAGQGTGGAGQGTGGAGQGTARTGLRDIKWRESSCILICYSVLPGPEQQQLSVERQPASPLRLIHRWSHRPTQTETLEEGDVWLVGDSAANIFKNIKIWNLCEQPKILDLN